MNETLQSEKEYVLGTNKEEIQRLGFQHQVWSAQASQSWERAGFKPGDNLLDLGSGPGFATLELSQIAGANGKVIAIDLSQRFINHLKNQAKIGQITNIVAEAGNIEDLNLPISSLDGAYARWVLCFTERVEAVVSAVACAIKPGGVFIIQDYYFYDGFFIAPKSEVVDRVFRAITESWRLRGSNPDIGSDLPSLMIRNGFEIKEINPLVKIARPNSMLWKLLESLFVNYIPTLVEMELITAADKEEFWKAFNERAKNPGSFLATPPMVEIFGVKCR